MQKGVWEKKLQPITEAPAILGPVLHPESGRNPSPLPGSSGPDDWEIDISQLKCNQKVANGSFGDL
jgi:hypothetical protein